MANYNNKTPLPPDGTILKEDVYTPFRLRNFEKRMELQENICKMVSKCTPIRSAFIANGIPEQTYFGWKRKYLEQLEEIKDTNYRTVLTEFFDAVYEADRNNESDLAEVLFRKAKYEEDLDAVKYALDKRHKWKETKQVEVDTPDDRVFELNIVPMEDKVNDNTDEKEEE